MPSLRLAFFPGATGEHYAALAEALAGAPVPAGRRVFAAGPVEGGWQVVQVWDDHRDLDDYNRDWLIPALEALGPRGFPQPPRVRDVELHDLHVVPGAGPQDGGVTRTR